jgi:hypothetical protein
MGDYPRFASVGICQLTINASGDRAPEPFPDR